MAEETRRRKYRYAKKTQTCSRTVDYTSHNYHPNFHNGKSSKRYSRQPETKWTKNSGRISPIPPDVFSDEELSHRQICEMISKTKLSDRKKNFKPSSRPRCRKESSDSDDNVEYTYKRTANYYLRILLDDSRIISQDNFKNPTDINSSSEDDAWMSISSVSQRLEPKLKIPADGLSELSNLELSSDGEENLKKKENNLNPRKISYSNITETEDLFLEEEKNQRNLKVRKPRNILNPSPISQLLEAVTSTGTKTKILENAAYTDVEEFEDDSESESQEETTANIRKNSAPQKKLSGPTKPRPSQQKTNCSRTIPKIIVSNVENDNKTSTVTHKNQTPLKSTSISTEEYKDPTKGSYCKKEIKNKSDTCKNKDIRNSNNRKSCNHDQQQVTKHKKHLKIAKKREPEPSDSEGMFLNPSDLQKKRKRSKNSKNKKEPDPEMVYTEVEELDPSDAEVGQPEKPNPDERITDIEELGISSESDFEDDLNKPTTDISDGVQTDEEEYQVSADDDSVNSILPPSPVPGEKSFIQIQSLNQTNWESPEEIRQSKNYSELPETHTDVENIDLPEVPKPVEPPRKTGSESLPKYEKVRSVSKSDYSTFARLFHDENVVRCGDVIKVYFSERKREKLSSKEYKEVPEVSKPKEWSEKGQSEEYAYETKDLEETARIPGHQAMEGNLTDPTQTEIYLSKVKSSNSGRSQKPRLNPTEKSQILNSLCDLLNSKNSDIKTSPLNETASSGAKDFDDILKDTPITPKDLDKCELLLKEEYSRGVKKPKADKSKAPGSDEFEQMLLDQGIITQGEYEYKMKLLEPNEQEFDKILRETCSEQVDITINEGGNETEKVVKFNQRQEKLTPIEIKKLEDILKTHAIEKDSKTKSSEPKTSVKPVMVTKADQPGETKPTQPKPLSTVELKTLMKVQSRFETKPRPQVTSPLEPEIGSVVTINKQFKQKLSPQEIGKMEEILKTHGVEGKPSKKSPAGESLPGSVVTFNNSIKQNLTPEELEHMEKIIRTHSIEEKSQSKLPESSSKPPGEYKQQQTETKGPRDWEPTIQTLRDSIVRTTVTIEERRVYSTPETTTTKKFGTDGAEPGEQITKLKPSGLFLPESDLKTQKKDESITDVRKRNTVVTQKTVSTPKPSSFPLTASKRLKSLKSYNIDTTLGVHKQVRPEPPKKVERIFRDEGLIHTEECDEYCNYIRKIEKDSSELENHLRALKLVDVSPLGRRKFMSRTDRINSSIDDFIRKLNQFDVDSWLPPGRSDYNRKLVIEEKEHSRSLDDLSLTRLMEDQALQRKSSALGQSSSKEISKLLVNGKKIETFSRSVLDLRRIGLPKDKRDFAPGIHEENEENEKPKIKLAVRTVDPSRSEIEIRSVGVVSHKKPLEYTFLDRRSSEVFGQSADASPYVDDPERPTKPLTWSLQSLDYEAKQRHPHRNYDKLQSMECLVENREVGSDPETSRYSRVYRHPSNSRASAKERIYFQVKSKPLDESPNRSSSSLSINRVYVHTPPDRQFRDLMLPKQPKSILKKNPNFQPKFESISLTHLPEETFQRTIKFKRDSYIKSSLEKSKSCGSVHTTLKMSLEEVKPTTQLAPLSRMPSWNKYVIPTSPLSQNRCSSSNSLSDSQSSSQMSAPQPPPPTNPPATLIHYVTPSKSIPLAKPYVDYYDWSKQNVSDCDVSLSELECVNIQSDDSDFVDRGYGVISGQVPKPDSKPIDEAKPFSDDKSKPDREIKIQVDDKSGGVKFYEIDDDEDDTSPKGNEPVPQITMPSYKKRVHSQRIPQPGRPAVTPYEGAYDEKYSSDEENIEYEVDEPDDITERSNSTVTFSEDIYDSDVIEEMMKNRKPSQPFQDIQDVQSPTEGPKVPKSILKDKGGKEKKGLTSTFIEPDAKGTGTEKAESTDTVVSPGEVPKILEETMADELERISQMITAGKDKVAEKGEEILEELTKETDKGTSEVKGEKEVVTKPMPSTISQQIDQITKTAATNQDELAKQDDSVTKPLQDILADKSTDKTSVSDTFEKVVSEKHKTTEAESQIPKSFKGSAPEISSKALDILSEPILSKDILNQLQKISEPIADSHKQSKEFSDEQTKIFTTNVLGTDFKSIIKPEKSLTGDIIRESQIIKDKITETLQDEFQRVDKLSKPIAETTTKVEMTLKDVQVKSSEDVIQKLTEAVAIEKENATKKAVELIDDITKTVEEIFPKSVEERVKLGVTPQPKTEETQPLQDFPTKKDSVTGVVSEEKVANGISKKIEKALEPEITPALEKEDLQKETKKSMQDVKDPFQTDKHDSKLPKEILTETVAKEVNKLSMGATTLKDDVSQASGKIVDDITQTIDKVSEQIKDVTEKVLKTENGVAKPLQEALTTKTGKISDMITTSDDELTKKGDEIIEKLDKETDKLSEKLSTVTGKAEEMFKSVQEAVPIKSEQVSKMAKSIKDELSEKGEQLFKDVGKSFTETIPKELDKVSKAIKEKSDKIGNGFTKEIDTVSDSVVSVKEDILKGSEKAFKDSKKVIEESTAVLSTETDNLIKTGDKVIEGIQKTVTESVTEKAKDLETISKDILVGTSATVESHLSFDDYEPDQASEPVTETDKISEAIKNKAGSILSDISSGLTKSIQGSFSAITGETPTDNMITDTQGNIVAEKSDEEQIPFKTGETPDQAESADKFDAKEPRRSDSEDSKPRVIFRIESEEELLSDLDRDPLSPSSTEEFGEKIKKDLKASLEREQLKLEEKLSSKGGIFDISGESLSRTKELVDERLRKISEVKPPKELEEPVKKEKPSKKTEFTETIKIGRFHVTPALVEEVVKKKKENEIAQRLKTSRQDEQEVQEEVEKEISERLTEADFEEVIRELKLEGLNTEVYFLPEEKEKKKERTLKRVERRFERMASETLEKEKEEADSVSEEKLDEKREVEFQRMLSQLSSEEVAECQQEYLQLWEEGGLNSLTPTEDWESRDPDTPENELDEDSPRKSESFRGSHGTGKNGEPIKPSEPKKPDTPAKSPVSPPKPLRVSDKISSGAQPVSVVEPLHVTAPSSDLVFDKSEDVPSYVDRKKFWEQMSSSQSGETVGDSLPTALQTVTATEVETKTTEDVISVKTVKQKFEKDVKSTESHKSFEEGGLVKSLTESYSQKIAAGELVMPAIPRPRSGVPKESPDQDTEPIQKDATPDSTGTAIVSELEIKLKARSPSAPITETTVISGSTSLEKVTKDVEFTIGSTVISKTKTEETKLSQEHSTDSEAEFIAKYGVESVAYDNTTFTEDDDVALPLSERKKIFEGTFDKQSPPVVPIRKSVHERSMSLPTSELAVGVKSKKKYFEEEMKKEMIVEQIMTQAEEPTSKPEEKDLILKKEQQTEEKVVPEVKKPDSLPTDLVKNGTTMIKETIKAKETTLVEDSGKFITTAVKTGLKLADKVPKTLDLKETHIDKSETEDTEKEKLTKTPQKKEEEPVPSITITATAKKQIETASIGESEDTQSESDVTPEEARVVDNGDTPWDGSGTQSGGLSPGDDIMYPKEIGETGIGRWVGQEDLSKQIWEKDDEIEPQYRVPITWERTRSEGASPKEHYVYTPEEHYPDTVWEVPVQEQLETEEITHDIPIEKQVIIEKDEEEEEEEDEDERKLRLTEDEAKEIAEDVLEYIQFEVENRASFLTSESDEGVQDVMHPQVTDYLHHLADKKDLDDQDIQLIESVILKKQRDRLKKTPTVGTTTSSVDITDEDLRSSGADNDMSPVESQMSKLQSLEERDYPKLSTEVPDNLQATTAQYIGEFDETEETAQTVKYSVIVDQTIAEVKEHLEAAKDELIEQHMYTREREILERDTSEFQFKLSLGQVCRPSDSEIQTEEREPKPATEEELEKTYTPKTEKKTEEHVTDKFESEKILKTIQTTTEVATTSSKTAETSKPGTEPEPHITGLEISAPESFVSRKMADTRYSSEESQRSTSLEDPMKSPPMGEDMLSSSSAEKPELKSEKSDVVFRHSSSSSLNVQLKADRRSGTDVEPYSSSGESHYQSFEHTSSRPCSSDVEALMASNVGTTGSSEYESALSQDVSSKPTTSMEYHTAVSSLSSRESIKSLDSESSGHLASVEVSSEASETLIPSALELDKDIETPATVCSDDESSGRKFGRPPAYVTQMSAPASTSKPLADDDFEIVGEADVVSWAGEASEEEDGTPPTGEEVIPPDDHSQKMKRSYEMTFQPEPQPISFSDVLDEEAFKKKYPFNLSVEEHRKVMSVPSGERHESSLEETGSILSTSVSTTSDTSGARTVIELSRTDSDKMDASLTMSATSIDSAFREELDVTEAHVSQTLTSEMSTSTTIQGMNKKTASVTITTSTSDEHGISNVSTQVTSVSRKSSMVDESKTDSDSQPSSRKGSDTVSHANGPTQVEYVPDYDEVETKTKKTQGHRRKESTSSFVPTMMWNVTEARPQRVKADITEIEEEYGDDKYVYDVSLTEKEVKNDEKKEADDSEKGEEPYEPGFEKYAQERQISEGEEIEEMKDFDRPQSQISRTDSESGRRPVSSIFSEDQPDSELSELMKQGSSETERDDPLERPLSPEPEDIENKDITPEFSSEAQASVTELEMEYSSACSRRDEYASHVSPIREERSELQFKGTTSEESVEEKSTEQLRSQKSIDTVEEKHESERGEKEILKKKDHTENDIPNITVTEHTPTLSTQKFQYPDAEETKEKKSVAKTPDTPASTSSRTSSSSTDQGREYNIEEAEMKRFFHETLTEEKEASDTKDEKESLDSPSSDSFEMLDKPDISDEYVIIEEVGREAQENDAEGKSIQIATQKKKAPKKVKQEEEVIVSPPPTATKMTDIKYFPSEEDTDQFLLESESPPQPTTRRFAELLKKKSGKDEKDEPEYDPQIEQSKKWVEMQFQGEQAAKVIGAYGYEMEFERAPLEDIKEEDINELDSSSKIGSMGSQKESLGSFGSVKDSFSSTPDYDVLAGKKYFTRSGDHDDVSMSSLQEFELIEKKILENGKKSGSSSSQDSLSSKKLGTSSKSGQGDDVSQASLREFENLEHACATVVTMETKAKQEEAILSEIDEGHESQISESESCETVSAVMREKIESDPEDFDKRMFEIDEIIKQAQSNVEKFSELQALEKIESMGRGDSYEEVAKVPDLELDMPLRRKPTYDHQTLRQDKGATKTSYSTQIVTKKKMQQWRESEATEEIKELPAFKTKPGTSKQSDLLENGGKIKSISVDSLEIQAKEKQILLEGKDDTVSLDSYKSKPEKSQGLGFSELGHKSDSLEEFSASLRHHESSSGEYSSSGRDDQQPPRADFMLGSSESLDPSSSTATHATYQYETDSVMSSSFTSGGSNTMVSSTDNLDLLASGQSVIDLGAARADDWLENLQVGGEDPFVQRLAEQRKTEQGVEVQKVTFKGSDAKKSLEEWAKDIGPAGEIVEMEEVDEHGNVHLKKVLRQRVLIRPDQVNLKDLTKEGLDEYLKNAKEKTVAYREKLEMGTIEPFVSEIIEPLQDDEFSHIVHKKFQMVPEVEKVVFRGPDAQEALEEYVKGLNTGEEIEETEEVDEHGNVHVTRMIRQRVVVQPGKTRQDEATEMIHRKIEMPPEVERVSFKGPDAEKALREYMASVKPETEVTESEYVDEDGNVHVRKVITERRVARPEGLSKEELEEYMKQMESQGGSQTQREVLQLGGDVQKIVFKGPDAEEQMREYLSSMKPEGEVTEEEEVDEFGNVHVKKILRQQVIIRPDQAGRELTKQELQQYLSSGKYEVAGSSQRIERAPEVQKLVFKGPDAEEQLKEYMKNLKPEEVEEIEEVDEDGNVHIKKVIRQRVLMRPEDLSQQLSAEGSSMVQKLSFRGPDAESALQEYLASLGPEDEVTEIEEKDEHGNIHVKKVLKQRVVIRPDQTGRELTKQELEQYLSSGKYEVAGSSQRIERAPEVQKLVFKGPDAEEQLKEYMKNLKPEEVEEIEEVDEDGNVHIKKVIRQRVVMRPEDLSQQLSAEGSSTVQKLSFRGPDAESALQEYLASLGPEDEVTEIEEKDEHGNIHIKKVLKRRVVIRPDQVGRELTKEKLEEYLRKTGQTTLHYENIDIGSREPFVSETIEPLDESQYSHIVHRTVQMAPDVQKVVFKGPNAEEALKAYVEALEPGEDVIEKEEVDEQGNVHLTRVMRRKIVMKPEDLTRTGLSGEQLKDYLKHVERETFQQGGGDPHASSFYPISSTNQTLTEAFSSSIKLTDKDQSSRGEKDDTESASAIQKESGSSQRPPLVSDISMDDEAEHDPTEHDWRHQLEFLHAEAAEDEIDENLDEILSASSIRAQKKH